MNVQTAIREAAESIEATRLRLNRDGVILGLSGGLDSTVVAYLCSQGVCQQKIHLVYLPEVDSKIEHRQDAKLVAEILGIPLRVRNISGIMRASGTYSLLPLRWAPGRKIKKWLVEVGKRLEGIEDEEMLVARLRLRPESWVAKGHAYILAKHRIRMMVLYQEANLHNYLVVGGANKTEWLTGTFVQWGCDQCADLMPIIHLYRSQVEMLARALQVPERILHKASDPDVIPGMPGKEVLLGDFKTVDLILWGLESGVQQELLYEQFEARLVRRVAALYEGSRFMREMPYRLSI